MNFFAVILFLSSMVRRIFMMKLNVYSFKYPYNLFFLYLYIFFKIYFSSFRNSNLIQ